MFNSVLGDGMSLETLIICSVASIIYGMLIAYVHSKTATFTKNFAITLVVLPVLVQVVIMMTSGSLGTGVAIMGTFSLVRFRSMPGTSRELVSVFFAMAMGLVTGVGYIGFAGLSTIMISGLLLTLHYLNLFDPSETVQYLQISMPEDIEHEEVLRPVFAKYQVDATLENVRLKNMGSIFELSYDLRLPKNFDRREFINDLRVRNRNLSIILGKNQMKGGL